MGDIVSDGTSFSCPLCTSKLKITVISSSAEGGVKKLATTGNFIFPPPPGAQCLLIPNAPAPCAPPNVSVLNPGQSSIEVDGKKVLGAGCQLQCAKSGLLTVASGSQSVAKHDEAAANDPSSDTSSKIDALFNILDILSLIPLPQAKVLAGAKLLKFVPKILKGLKLGGRLRSLGKKISSIGKKPPKANPAPPPKTSPPPKTQNPKIDTSKNAANDNARPAANDNHRPPSAPVGKRESTMKNNGPRNPKTEIEGRTYSGHAVDQMQNRGIPPSVVDHTIKEGTPTTIIRNGKATTNYYDATNNVTAVVNNKGEVVTVGYGKIGR